MSDLLAAFGAIASSMEDNEDAGASFPNSDAKDLQAGARFIPGPVTMARRRGQLVKFVQDCSHPNCWYWEFQQEFGGREAGSRIFHYSGHEPDYHECEGCGNAYLGGGDAPPREDFEPEVVDPCPDCGAELTVMGGGHMEVVVEGYDSSTIRQLKRCTECGYMHRGEVEKRWK